jgi:large subunit ribosomal protein L17
MRHRKNTFKFNRTASHRDALFRNQVVSFLQHEKITTTLAKAKRTGQLAERLITLGKRGDLHARRVAFRVLRNDTILKKLFDDIAPRFKDVSGGYTRILQLEPRKGDAADMALLQLTVMQEKGEKKEEKKKGKKTRGKAAAAAPAKEKSKEKKEGKKKKPSEKKTKGKSSTKKPEKSEQPKTTKTKEKEKKNKSAAARTKKATTKKAKGQEK